MRHRTMSTPIGTSFYRSALPPAFWRRQRDEQLLDLVKGKRVVHVGCTDAPLTTDKLRDGTLLHERVLAVCEAAVGVDIDGEGLARLESRLGGRYLHADATDTAALLPAVDLRPTVVLAADVIEHVADAGRFLAALAWFGARCDSRPQLVLSTPNGLSVRAPILAAAGLELTHPDHRVVYTPATLTRSLNDAGYRPTSWSTYSVSLGRSAPRRVFDVTARAISRVRPTLADGMIVVADLH